MTSYVSPRLLFSSSFFSFRYYLSLGSVHTLTVLPIRSFHRRLHPVYRRTHEEGTVSLGNACETRKHKDSFLILLSETEHGKDRTAVVTPRTNLQGKTLPRPSCSTTWWSGPRSPQLSKSFPPSFFSISGFSLFSIELTAELLLDPREKMQLFHSHSCSARESPADKPK